MVRRAGEGEQHGTRARRSYSAPTRNGFDMFAASMFGARNSLLIGGLAITFGLLFGTILGMISGYFRRQDRSVSSRRSCNILACLSLRCCWRSSSSRSSTTPAARHLAETQIHRADHPCARRCLSIPPLTRLVRANTIAYAQRDFVVAARSLGASEQPHPVPRDPAQHRAHAACRSRSPALALLIVAEGALAYLGLSVEAPLPTWGGMISAGPRAMRRGAWWISLMPAAVMFLTILGDQPARRRAGRAVQHPRGHRMTRQAHQAPTSQSRRAAARGHRPAHALQHGARPGASRSTAVSFTLDRGAALGIVGESGSRQDRPVAVDHGLAAEAQHRHARARSCSKVASSSTCR